MIRLRRRTAKRTPAPDAPPRFPARLVGLCSRYEEDYEAAGDLAEEYVEQARRSGRRRASLWYWGQAAFGLVSYLRLNLRLGVDMLKNIVKTAFRNMARHKAFSFINLAGLTVGLTLGLLALLYVRHEFGTDGFHERPQDIYRIITRQPGNVYQGTDWWALSPAYMADAVKKSLPEVELAARVRKYGAVLRQGDRLFRESSILFADEDFLRIFRYRVLEGAGAEALDEPLTIWLTREMARKYFGSENPIGRTLLYDSQYLFRVAGILETPSRPSHLEFDFLASISSLREIEGAWGREMLTRTSPSVDFTTYVRLRPGAEVSSLSGRLQELSNLPGDDRLRNIFALQPLRRIHLFSRFNFDISANGDIRTVSLLSAVGLIILLIAGFNFMNLFTARAATRAKEIGVRKVLGSESRQLRRQFFGEALLFTVMAAGAAVLLTALLLPPFNSLVGRRIGLSLLAEPGTLLGGAAIVLFVACVAGVYPAVWLSSWSPIPILKGATPSGRGAKPGLRSFLVVFQFAASIALLAGTFIIGAQMRFIQSKDLGFEKDHIITLRAGEEQLRKNAAAFRDEILKNPRVLDFTASFILPSYIGGGGPKKQADGREIVFYRAHGDARFIDFYGMKLLQGRGFSPDHPTDATDAVIVNETAVRAMGWTDPIGRRLQIDDEAGEATVIGVVKDFHFHDLTLPVMPLWIRLTPDDNPYFSIKISSSGMAETIQTLELLWKKYSPNTPFAYTFLDERIARMYADERAFAKLFRVMTWLASFLACLGLVGLAAFTAESRMKELAIRRVLGSTVSGVAGLLYKGFLMRVAVAAAAGFPVAWLAAQSWLEKFAYRIRIGWTPFAAALLLSLAMAFLSVVIQSYRAAAADPVRRLRTE